MLRHNFLYNPIKQTRIMEPEEFTKYIKLHTTFTNPKTVEEIKQRLYSSHQNVDKAELDKIWNPIYVRIINNSALAEFILDYGGAESDFFFPWLQSVATSMSEALEMAYGSGYGVDGKWYDQVPEDDNIADFIHNVPTFVFQRERQLMMADLVSWAEDIGRNSKPSKVIDLGAGRMAWARKHGFQFNGDVVKILAVDKDANIPDDLFKDPESLGIKYEQSDFIRWLNTTTIKEDADLIMLGGVASYFPLPKFVEVILKPVYRVLKPGGAFFFDLQLDCLQYEWTIKLFDWSKMQLEKSADEAIAKVENIRRQLWEAGMKFSAEYSVDTPNALPSAIMVTFQKI